MSVTYGGDSITFADNSTISSGYTGFKNKLINGKFEIQQKGTVTGVQGDTLTDAYGIDRWKQWVGASGMTGISTWSVSADVPEGQGFKNSLSIAVTTASTPSSLQSCALNQRIEGYNISDLAWGTSNAATVTLSFWAKSTKTGTYSVALYSACNTGNSPTNVREISVTNTWQKFTLTYSGQNVNSDVHTGNSQGIGVYIMLNAGSSKKTAATTDAWVAYDGSNFATPNQVNFYDTVGNTFYITGAQLEKGSVATSFDHRPYSEELAMCQRYFVTLASGGSKAIAMVSYQTSTYFEGVVHFPVTMRATPSLECTTGTDYYAFYRNGWDYVNSLSAEYANINSSTVYNTTEAGGGTAGYTGWLSLINASARLSFNAEL